MKFDPIWSFFIKIDHFRSIFDWKIEKDCPNVNYLIENGELYQKTMNYIKNDNENDEIWSFSTIFN